VPDARYRLWNAAGCPDGNLGDLMKPALTGLAGSATKPTVRGACPSCARLYSGRPAGKELLLSRRKQSDHSRAKGEEMIVRNVSSARRVMLLLLGVCIATTAFGEVGVRRHSRRIPGRYITLLRQGLPRAAYEGVMQSLANSYDLAIMRSWNDLVPGFICTTAAATDADRLVRDPRVLLVEEDFTVEMPTFSGAIANWYNGNYLWHLDRIDQRYDYVDASTHTWVYNRCPEAGEVVAYMIDTGLLMTHDEFLPAGRVAQYRFDGGVPAGTPEDESCAAVRPHGTWTASVLAGANIGASVAKIASLRVAPCNPYAGIPASNFVSAVTWIRSDADPYRYDSAVVSMSMFLTSWTEGFQALNTEVTTLVSTKRIPFFVSANNFSGDACQFAPASLAYTNTNKSDSQVVFVAGGTSLGGGTDMSDYRWQEWTSTGARLGQDSGSNGGRCISIYAPACEIYLADAAASNAYLRNSGTSFSAPLVAAIGARYIAQYRQEHANATPDYKDVYDYLLASATSNVVQNTNTPQSWLCESYTDGKYYGYDTVPMENGVPTCPVGYRLDPGAPRYMPATTNETGAGLLYYNHACP
jgi:hypothetical protein